MVRVVRGLGGSGVGAVVIPVFLPETKIRPKESDSDDFHFSDSEGALGGADLGPQNPLWSLRENLVIKKLESFLGGRCIEPRMLIGRRTK